jgi:hypothetical protein
MGGSEQRGEIGRLERVALREVWPHEAHDFTRWLEENTDLVSEVAGFELQNVEREQAAGAFSVDLIGEDGRARLTRPGSSKSAVMAKSRQPSAWRAFSTTLMEPAR